MDIENYEKHLYTLDERVRALREDVRKLTSLVQGVRNKIGNSILHESDGRNILLRLHLLERDIASLKATRRLRVSADSSDPDSKPLKKKRKVCCWRAIPYKEKR